jgi:hypothetical protein
MSLQDLFRKSADRSDERAKELGIDPPRAGRKTYAERRAETEDLPTDELLKLRAKRVEEGKEVGVIERVLSKRTDLEDYHDTSAQTMHDLEDPD